MRRRLSFLFTCLTLSLALAGAGCAAGSPGALEQADFRVGCAADDDACPIGGMDAPLAVGTRQHLEIDLQIPGSANPTAPLLSLAPQIILAQGFDLMAQEEGMCAILVQSADGQVLDFIHLWTARPDALKFHLLDDRGMDLGCLERDLQMAAGENLRVQAVPHQGDISLLGQFEDSRWSVQGEALQLLDEGLGQHRRIRALQPGSASIQMEAAGMQVALSVEVLP